MFNNGKFSDFLRLLFVIKQQFLSDPIPNSSTRHRVRRTNCWWFAQFVGSGLLIICCTSGNLSRKMSTKRSHQLDPLLMLLIIQSLYTNQWSNFNYSVTRIRIVMFFFVSLATDWLIVTDLLLLMVILTIDFFVERGWFFVFFWLFATLLKDS